MKTCLEVVSYRLVDGVNEETYMEYVNLLQGALCNQVGFIKREVYFNKQDGVWVELAEWESQEAARQCEATIMQKPFMAEAMALIDGSTLQLHFVKQLI
ncbi:hypothetical protein EJP77_08510 [Paenibacillus zeisoli]|uniref:ABM domain-containing protein n=1 Tax=Paenibacillus zeisoli TaxID=2496267 RepID=A0A433XHW3_9BACL|nr:hypothetical protein [Paenibacillus zeisoli]RUT33667.1 hypothetical protein EJP77_08510 [Paenibacillus zeisoli]